MKPSVLIVDDAPEVRRLFRSLLKSSFSVDEAADGEQALEAVNRRAPDVVLLDLSMPGLDGYETCRRLKQMPAFGSTRVIVVSAHSDAEDLQEAFDAGADDFLVKPVSPSELLSRVRLHARLRSTIGGAADLKSSDDSGDQRLLAALDRSQEVLANTLLKLAENRDNETGEHLVRMRDYAVILAKELRRASDFADEIDESFVTDLHWACPLHDIGKVGIPDEVLLKAGKLTPQEFAVMKKHTSIGASILEQAVCQMNGRGFLVMAVDIARSHHERWDGEGYPIGLAGTQIPLAARIVAVADVYDALTTERCYKKAWTPASARQTIEAGKGSQFDPIVVAAFERCFAKFLIRQNRCAGKDASSNESPPPTHRQYGPQPDGLASKNDAEGGPRAIGICACA